MMACKRLGSMHFIAAHHYQASQFPLLLLKLDNMAFNKCSNLREVCIS